MKKAILFAMLFLSLFSLTAAQISVVGEVFTEVWWPYCPRARTGLFNLYENQPNVIPLIWQGDSANESPGYSQRRGLVGSSSQGIPQAAFQGLYLEVGAAVDAYNAQYLPRYNQIINTEAPMTIDAVFLGSNGQYTLSANVALEENFDNSDVKIVFILAREVSADYFSSVIAYENTDFTLTSAGESSFFEQTFNINSSWDPETIKGYVMVQKWLSADSEIYQAAEAGSPAVSMTDASFGQAYIGSEFTKSFVVANIGNENTDVSITMDAPGFALSGDMNYSLVPDETRMHTITFLPTSDQTYSGYINVATDIPGYENNTITLSGSGFPNEAPVVENLRFEGTLMTNSSIDVIYDFIDADDDDEGDTNLQWYISDDGENWSDFHNINADIMTLHFNAEHIGKYFKFAVLPIDEHQMPGQEVSIATPSAVINLAPPANLAYTVENGNNIVLTWQAPEFPELRALFGYKIFRGSSVITTIMDTETFTYTDENVEDGTYTYSIRAIYSPGGLSGDSNILEITINAGVSNENDTQEIILSDNAYPNPFSDSSSLNLQVKREQIVTVAIYNIRGQLIKTLAERTFKPGSHSVSWDGTNQNGSKCSDGVYFYKVKTPEKTSVSKTLLIK